MAKKPAKATSNKGLKKILPEVEIDNYSRYVGLAKISRNRYLVDFTSGQLDANLDGECLHKEISGIITIDPTLRGKACLDTLVHEILHAYFDSSGILSVSARKRDEEIVTELATQIADAIFTPECMRRCGF